MREGITENSANAKEKKEHDFIKLTKYPPHTYVYAFINVQIQT